ncbi:hypothetical protein A3C32_01240 [Candidatus Daviesbacteria bacterium RIFCSPHIGHO2_02_FULL_41_14]|uniref:Uncharacterized protein n=1 Tax=Candidatus Daviesbacteria bacterium RIFCSPLOWO2_01_FULL_40_24 TaxID=1797787 RepID=A0A1F5MK35_9BACT|nr:MAG: hypothetical protein A2780_02370 [Candidatus Daviesbacteria bacterium RIFCSPHIGHO2_01_FULL_41_45]OGE35024.1 MAG: hypothetical protein A3C32_01240 [Candidatus Daviesbacteria bacterium RIFCSPHIGHO2_02_FULL_41_14]OGE65731.1 MAG: hypothetical protein A3B49_02650 [Candidatus Daviesbacteria bacterium RIFCSPLOWO2_01_FULL_40_24]
MVIWLLLFFIVILISFVLAIRSLRHYRENPARLGVTFSLYLIQNTSALTESLLEELNREVLEKRLVISFERLYKGDKKALIIYGPSLLLTNRVEKLGLLELEDYAIRTHLHTQALEIGVKANADFQATNFHLAVDRIGLQDQEQLWWQVIVQPQIKNKGEIELNSLIRVVIHTQEVSRLAQIQGLLMSGLEESHLTRLPQTHSSKQILKFYKERVAFRPFSTNKESLLLNLNDLFGLISIA